MKSRFSNFISLILLLLSAIFSYFITIENENLPTDNKLKSHIDTLWISVVGDIMCHTPQIRDAYTSKGQLDFSHMFDFVKPIISESDLAIGNLETVLAGTNKKFSGYPLFNSPDEFVDAIRGAGFDVLITANNHCLDRGFYGLKRTIKILDSLGIQHCGTYISKEDSEKPLIVEIKGIKLAILSYTYGTNGISPPSGKEFCVSYIDTLKIFFDIHKAKNLNPDKIIVYLHWGNEYQRFPDSFQIILANFLFNNGVDLIFGSHPHVIQPAQFKLVKDSNESEKKVFVIYSLGNFISNQRDKFTDSGVIVHLSLIKDHSTNKTMIDTVLFTPTYVSKIGGRFRIIPIIETLKGIEAGDLTLTKLFSIEEKKLKQILQEFEKHIWMK